jgi:hypothetical protein
MFNDSLRRILPGIALAWIGCGDNHAAQAPDAGAPTVDAAPTPPPAPSLHFYDYVQAVDVTPDGRTAVFGDISTLENRLWFVDTVTNEATMQTVVGDSLRAFATGIAANLAVSALHGAEPVDAAVWKAGDDWTSLPSPHAQGCDQDISSAWDISADGTVVVGATWNECAVEAARWVNGALTRLEVLGERLGGGTAPPDNRPSAVSDDGAITAGFAMTSLVDRAPVYWTADGTGHFLPRSAEDAPGEVLAVNADGSVLAGVDSFDAVIWGGGTRIVIPRLDTLLPFDPVFANALTADGSIVFGAQGGGFGGPQDAYMWSLSRGLRKVADVATDAGLTIPPDITLSNVSAVSADGTVIVGTASNVNTMASSVFTLRLPASAL